jgi:hypothetical protein
MLIAMGPSAVHELFLAGHFLTAALGVVAIFWLFRPEAGGGGRMVHAFPKWGLALVGLAVIVFELASLRLSSPPQAFWDFLRAYYPAGQAALDHDAAALKALMGEGVGGGFVNIPAVAYLFAPFAWLPPRIAAVLFTVIGIALTVGAWLLLVRLARLERREQWLLALLFLVNGPLLSGIKWANISYFLVFLLAAGLVLLRGQRSFAAGLLLGLAAVLKPALVLFGIFFLLRRDLRGVLGFALVGVTTVVASLVLFGWATNLYWLQTSILQYSHNWLAVSGNQSVPAFLFRLHEPPSILLDFTAKTPGAGEKLVSQLINMGIFLIAAAACCRPFGRPAVEDGENKVSAGERRDLQYLLTMCLCLVASPLSWAHYYAWLLIPTAFFLGGRPALLLSTPARILGWTAIALATPLVLWPEPAAHSALAAFYASFAVSHHLFGGLLWFGLIAWWLARSGGLLSQASPTTSARTAPSVG